MPFKSWKLLKTAENKLKTAENGWKGLQDAPPPASLFPTSTLQEPPKIPSKRLPKTPPKTPSKPWKSLKTLKPQTSKPQTSNLHTLILTLKPHKAQKPQISNLQSWTLKPQTSNLKSQIFNDEFSNLKSQKLKSQITRVGGMSRRLEITAEKILKNWSNMDKKWPGKACLKGPKKHYWSNRPENRSKMREFVCFGRFWTQKMMVITPLLYNY